ncbi:hypothetical protein PYV02_06745 [Leifsonia sp. H3M29-4]|uniref:hypothetical protein n=1 Tax=Salinibacterium metalliresistens TaxID=3031321 RepID=UPI0023DB96B8|nr:hypothetical protein [Salinibacterium metalliresistens]MDF1478781.1 hypothetical protein [Salinibacterium metalliresistens]
MSGQDSLKALRAELVKIRGDRGLTIDRVRKYAPRLMHLPCVDAEMLRRGRSESERAHTAVDVVWCLVENGGFDSRAQDLLRTTLNYTVSLTILEERKADLYVRLETHDRVKQYEAYEEDVYKAFIARLARAEKSPCTPKEPPTSPGGGELDIDVENARRGARAAIETVVASLFKGRDAAAYPHLREIVEEYAPKAARRFFSAGVSTVQGLAAMLRTLAGSRYPFTVEFYREHWAGIYTPPEFLEYLPFLPALLETTPPRGVDLPSEVRDLRLYEVLNWLGISMIEVSRLVRDTAELIANLIIEIEEHDEWERAISKTLNEAPAPMAQVEDTSPVLTEGGRAFEAGA